MTTLVAVLHPLTWMHICIAMTEAFRAPLVVGGIVMLIQRALGDTYTHPIVFATTAFMIAELYRAHDANSRMNPIVPKVPRTFDDMVRIASYGALIVMDIVWTPLAGVTVIVLLRVMDRMYVTRGRLGTHKILAMLPIYIFTIAGSVSKNPNAVRAVHMGITISTAAICGALALATYWKGGNGGWLAQIPGLAQLPTKKAPSKGTKKKQ